MIKNKKMFYINGIGIIITILCFASLPILYLTAIISALILVIINKGYNKKSMSQLLRDVEWEIIFFFISLYVVVGCLLLAGFQEIFTDIPFNALHPILLSLILLLMVSGISGTVANTPTALIFIPIIQILIDPSPGGWEFAETPLLFAFIIGINLGGNFLVQGAACDMMTLKIARDSGVQNLNYRRLAKNGALFAFIHIGFAILYIIPLVLLTG